MRKILILLFISFFAFQQSWAELVEPQIDNKNKTMDLGKDVNAALAKWNKKFQSYELMDYMEPVTNLFAVTKDELPMAVKGDFNGDGVSDVALMGHDKSKQYFIMVISDAKKEIFKVYEIRKTIASDPKKVSYKIDDEKYVGFNTYLSLLPARMFGKAKNTSKDKRLLANEVKPDGVQIEIYRSSATQAFIFDGKKVVVFEGELQ